MKKNGFKEWDFLVIDGPQQNNAFDSQRTTLTNMGSIAGNLRDLKEIFLSNMNNMYGNTPMRGRSPEREHKYNSYSQRGRSPERSYSSYSRRSGEGNYQQYTPRDRSRP